MQRVVVHQSDLLPKPLEVVQTISRRRLVCWQARWHPLLFLVSFVQVVDLAAVAEVGVRARSDIVLLVSGLSLRGIDIALRVVVSRLRHVVVAVKVLKTIEAFLVDL